MKNLLLLLVLFHVTFTFVSPQRGRNQTANKLKIFVHKLTIAKIKTADKASISNKIAKST